MDSKSSITHQSNKNHSSNWIMWQRQVLNGNGQKRIEHSIQSTICLRIWISTRGLTLWACTLQLQYLWNNLKRQPRSLRCIREDNLPFREEINGSSLKPKTTSQTCPSVAKFYRVSHLLSWTKWRQIQDSSHLMQTLILESYKDLRLSNSPLIKAIQLSIRCLTIRRGTKILVLIMHVSLQLYQ